jgi:hypothetical protein
LFLQIAGKVEWQKDDECNQTQENQAAAQFAAAIAAVDHHSTKDTRCCCRAVVITAILIGQVQHGTTVATVHEGHYRHSWWQGTDQGFVEVVVTNVSGTGVIDGHQRFVVPVVDFFVPIVVVPDTSAVACIFNKKRKETEKIKN